MGIRFVSLVGIACVVVAAGTRAAQPLESVMRQKLDRFQHVLAGIVEQDFLAVEREALALIRLTEMAEWSALATTDYRRYSQEFRAELEALVSAANGRNLDRATRAYQDAVSRCVRCHTYVRDARNASRAEPAGASLARAVFPSWPGPAAFQPPAGAARRSR